jgi:phosphomannomutase
LETLFRSLFQTVPDDSLGSNTEPIVRIMAEGESEERARELSFSVYAIASKFLH